jgi:ABC-type antimicrobial peptide transport system permease subunit
MSNLAITARLAGRGLIRRKSATFRIAASLIVVFVLATVAIAGGIIANQTTRSWVEKAIGRNVIAIGHQEMCIQYEHLLSKFQEANESSDFNYTLEKYQLPKNLSEKLNSLRLDDIDARIILEEQVQELPGYMFDPNGTTYSVGDSHVDTSLVVGIDPKKAVNNWFMDGTPLKEADDLTAMVGDSLAQKIFTSPLNQSIIVHTHFFGVASVCLDPLNNGKVVYVPIESLKTATNISEPNLILVRVNTDNHLETLNQIKAAVKSVNPEFDAIELNEVLDKNLGFLNYVWSTMMLLPLFSLVAASLCLIGYVILAIAEERREFGVLRALGASPIAVIKIVSVQLLTVLLSCFAAGVSLGIILTLMILIPEPIVTTYTVLEIAGWLLAALTVMFLLGLYPAVRFSKRPLLEAISNPS